MDKKTSQRQKRQPKVLEGNLWDCSVCTFSNTAEAFKCAMCDVRKGTSTRKPRLNPQLVAQQVAQAQHMTATVTAPPKQPQQQQQQLPPSQQQQPQRREDSNPKDRKPPHSTLANQDEKVSKKKIRNIRPRLKNVDRSQVHSQPVTVNNITVVITEYLPKPVPSSSSQAPPPVVTASEEQHSSGPVTNHSEIPNGLHIPPPKPTQR